MLRIPLQPVVLAAAILALASCALTDPILKPGWRQVVFTVENASGRPAPLFVAKDEASMGEVVGTANPGSVPARTTMDVTFGLPPDEGWAIFVNPGPNVGPLFASGDVPADFSGKAPATISIDAQGNVGAAFPAEALPGWMGNP